MDKQTKAIDKAIKRSNKILSDDNIGCNSQVGEAIEKVISILEEV